MDNGDIDDNLDDDDNNNNDNTIQLNSPPNWDSILNKLAEI